MKLNCLTIAFSLAAFAFGSLVSAEEAAVADAPTATLKVFGDGKLVVPSAFKKAEAKSNIIQHEFSASVGDGDDAPKARITMMPASGGVGPNIDRWKGQFSGNAKKVGDTEVADSGSWKVHTIEVSGQYADRMGGGPFFGGKTVTREDYGMLGAILVHPKERTYFVKMIGPNAVIQAHKKAFKDMVLGVGK